MAASYSLHLAGGHDLGQSRASIGLETSIVHFAAAAIAVLAAGHAMAIPHGFSNAEQKSPRIRDPFGDTLRILCSHAQLASVCLIGRSQVSQNIPDNADR